MLGKFGLIKGIEEDVKNPKTKYQVFEAMIRSEKISAVIPFDLADDFLAEVTSIKPTTTNEFTRIVNKYDGGIE